MNIIQAMQDPAVFGQHFRNPESWAAWRSFMAALFALPMTEDELERFQVCTGREAAPTKPATEAWLICGRRSGKSFTLGLVAVFLAAFKDWKPFLGPNERCTVMIIAADRRQSRVIMRYITGLLKSVPMLAQLIESEKAESIDLTNRLSIEIHTASFKTTRGYSVCAALCDEIAFWPIDESAAEPDTEILSALRPAMATVPGAILLCASSPYAKRGALYQAFKRHFGKDDDPILAWRAPTRMMNGTVPQSVIDEAMTRDAASARSEYLAEFRSDIETFVQPETVERCLGDHVELLPDPKHRYHAFVDPSGGSSDSFTMAVAHRDKHVVIDAIRETRPPFSPEAVITEFATLLKSYGITQVRGDRYAGEFPRELFQKHGIIYRTGDKTKSDLYRDFLPLLNSGTVCLPRADKLVAQLCGLERRTSRSGKDSIDRGPGAGAHDDVANAVAGVADLIATVARASPPRFGHYWGGVIELFEPEPATNVIEGTVPCTLQFEKEREPPDPEWFKVIKDPTPRIW